MVVEVEARNPIPLGVGSSSQMKMNSGEKL
jgi:hypothetical protein